MRERCRCPECKSLWVKQRTRGWLCLSCDNVFAVPYRTPAKTKSSSGSGQIAGRITIPNYRWGSSRLG
jgi:ribosomal protein L37AE/L43A